MTEKSKQSKKQTVYKNGGGAGGGAYFMGMIGAVIYYIQQSDTFGTFVLALLKALVWPAFLVYHALKFMHG